MYTYILHIIGIDIAQNAKFFKISDPDPDPEFLGSELSDPDPDPTKNGSGPDGSGLTQIGFVRSTSCWTALAYLAEVTR